ncbi:MAG: hypothetical protein KZQ93_20560 [Candidatus Thiodiazotropha sp. (ex Monitilora ramsayi)]|nr:hypothetical protein [Candidatus Thiodiazotropha sp. (ex Monitilora ramsayi)]
MDTEKLNRTAEYVSVALANKEYKLIEKFTRGIRLSAEDIEEAIDEYGRTVTSLPSEGYTNLDVVEVASSNPKEWSVYIPVYTKEEGLSDLTLEVTMRESTSELFEVELDNLHVL